MQTIRVRAVGDAKLPVPGASSPRYVGRARDGEIIPEGVIVPADSYHLRALRRGELVEVTT